MTDGQIYIVKEGSAVLCKSANATGVVVKSDSFERYDFFSFVGWCLIEIGIRNRDYLQHGIAKADWMNSTHYLKHVWGRVTGSKEGM